MGVSLLVFPIIQLLLLVYSMFIGGDRGFLFNIQAATILCMSFAMVVIIIWALPSLFVFYGIQILVLFVTAAVL